MRYIAFVLQLSVLIWLSIELRQINDNFTIDAELARNKYISDSKLYFHRGCQAGHAFTDDLVAQGRHYSIVSYCDEEAETYAPYVEEQAAELGKKRFFRRG